MEQTSKPTMIGVLNITAGVSGLIGGFVLLLLAVVGAGVLGATLDGDEQAFALLPLAFFLPLALMCLTAGAVAVWGGFAALNRTRWTLVILAGVAATVCFFPLGIAALVLTIMAENEFRASALPKG